MHIKLILDWICRVENITALFKRSLSLYAQIMAHLLQIYCKCMTHAKRFSAFGSSDTSGETSMWKQFIQVNLWRFDSRKNSCSILVQLLQSKRWRKKIKFHNQYLHSAKHFSTSGIGVVLLKHETCLIDKGFPHWWELSKKTISKHHNGRSKTLLLDSFMQVHKEGDNLNNFPITGKEKTFRR